MFQLITALQAWLTTRSTDERGATMVEYGLIVAAIAVVVFAAASTFGGAVTTTFNSLASQL